MKRLLLVVAFASSALLGQARSVRAQAQPSTGGDHDTVWVNTSSRVYHCPGSRWYGATSHGEYELESVAVFKGYRPERGKACGAGATARAPAKSAGAPAPVASGGVRVWVNTASGVYHCPGTRWYGATKAGEYMSEAAARAQGDRPAYGRPCS